MKREDVIAAGMEVHDVQHSMKRRTPWHDYSRKGTYMITLVVRDRAPLFGVLKGSLETSVGDPPHVEFSALAAMIEQEEVRKIHYYYPQVEVWKLCIMPDHLHMILRVNEDLGAGKHLGQIVRGFKTGCSRAWWSLTDGSGTAGNAAGTVATAGNTVGTVATAPSGSPEVLRPVLFEKGYNDKILLHEGQLENWKRYLDDNPRRLMTKRKNPGLFTVLTGMEVVGEQCQIVGNRFLLDVPDKMAVIVHRRYTDEENALETYLNAKFWKDHADQIKPKKYTTGISSIGSEAKEEKTAIYDLKGHKVTELQPHGMYIVNGKKVMK